MDQDEYVVIGELLYKRASDGLRPVAYTGTFLNMLAVAPLAFHVEPDSHHLCKACNRWHDKPGQALIGWRREHDGRWCPLPPGHVPTIHKIPADWIAVHEECNGIPFSEIVKARNTGGNHENR